MDGTGGNNETDGSTQAAEESVSPDVRGSGVSQGSMSSNRPRSFSPQQRTVLTWKDFADLPGQVLPEETVHHLRAAGREAALAVYSLWRSIDKARKGASGEKVRKHIDVE